MFFTCLLGVGQSFLFSRRTPTSLLWENPVIMSPASRDDLPQQHEKEQTIPLEMGDLSSDDDDGVEVRLAIGKSAYCRSSKIEAPQDSGHTVAMEMDNLSVSDDSSTREGMPSGSTRESHSAKVAVSADDLQTFSKKVGGRTRRRPRRCCLFGEGLVVAAYLAFVGLFVIIPVIVFLIVGFETAASVGQAEGGGTNATDPSPVGSGSKNRTTTAPPKRDEPGSWGNHR